MGETVIGGGRRSCRESGVGPSETQCHDAYLGCVTWGEPLSFPIPHPDEGGVQRRRSPSSLPTEPWKVCVVQIVTAVGLGVWGTSVGRGDAGEMARMLDFVGNGGT